MFARRGQKALDECRDAERQAESTQAGNEVLCE